MFDQIIWLLLFLKTFTIQYIKYVFAVNLIVATSVVLFAVLAFRENAVISNPKHVDVIIIGAGFSGIGAGISLHQKGITDFVILEAKDYIGGRVKKAPFAGVNVPLGAAWIHRIENNNLVWKIAQEYGLQFYYDDYDDLIYRDGDTGNQFNLVWQEKSKILDYLLETKVKDLMKTKRNDIDLKDALNQLGWNAVTKLENAIEYTRIDFEMSDPTSVVSAINFETTGEGQDVIVIDDRGYEYVAEIIATPINDKIELHKDVRHIKRQGNKYFVKTSDGSLLTSKYLLVSVSNGVLQNNYINFEPELPQWKLKTLNQFTMGHYCKIFLQFPYKFWDDSNYIIIGRVSKDYLHWHNWDRIFPGKYILVVTLTGPECKISQLESDYEVTNKVHEILVKVYGDNIPKPIDMLRSNWTYDPHFQGGFSRANVGTTDEDYHLMQQPVNEHTLWFTGEYASSFERSGYVSGAVETGIEIGEKLANHILLSESY